MRLAAFHFDGDRTDVRPALSKNAIGRTRRRLHKLKTNAVADAKTVHHVFPIGTANHERNRFRLYEIVKLFFPSAPKRPEMDILDPSDIEALIDEQTSIERLRIKSSDEMTTRGVRSEIDGLIGIHQQHVDE